ncbi:hypothetical protein VNI00_001740 [Paramarasmius palmivorus]|uniref:Uncharacterized protein n=1 Tax=Paramarasmius palmivorus TaxID=297713 RepID=A0AAW0E3C6_9AGAR
MSLPLRQSTVYDLSSLRLHANSERVQSDRRFRRSQLAVRDSRGNWIAKDAGGLGRVTRYRTIRDKEQGREMSVDVARSEDEGLTSGGMAVTNSEEEPVIKTKRARKRRKFYNDFDYIASQTTHGSSSSTPQPEGLPLESTFSPNPVNLPPPSSDLLKCLHYVTNQYYHEHGQLLNSSKDYRREKKERRLAKLGTRHPRPLHAKTADEDEEDGSDSESSDESDNSDGDEDAKKSSEPMREAENKKKRRKKRKGEPKRQKTMLVDMYRTMNGSALMALGMLIQEHVIESLTPRIPEDWESSNSDAENQSIQPNGGDDSSDEPTGRPSIVENGDESSVQGQH